MDTENLKKKASELGDKAQEFVNRPEVQDALAKGKDLLEKGKDQLERGKDKLEDFVEEKTDGKGIFGFGEKENPKK